jgi:GNAT superfamily N-acetyltransferase
VLPPAPGWQRVERDGVCITLHPLPFAQLVEPVELDPDRVDTAIEVAREVVRDHGRTVHIWAVGGDHPWLGERLAARGLVNTDTPGFESVENAMALVEPPAGGRPEGIAVNEITEFEDFAAGMLLSSEVFGMPAAAIAELEAALPERFDEYKAPGFPFRQWNASIDGRLAGTAAAATCPAGVNLFGGSVHADARGRGVYRALMHARWDFAVARGTPALTVQAGRMSMPIAERLGFERLGAFDVWVDEFE